MKKISFSVSSPKLILITALYFGTVLNLSFWRFIYEHPAVSNLPTAVFSVFFAFIHHRTADIVLQPHYFAVFGQTAADYPAVYLCGRKLRDVQAGHFH